MKKIFISYSPDSGFSEKKFIVETINQLNDNNLKEVIWFDKNEKCNFTSSWYSDRMEMAEKCSASLLFITQSYFASPVSLLEMKIMLERHENNFGSIKLFPVFLEKLVLLDTEQKQIEKLSQMKAVDLTGIHLHSSLAEKTSVVVGSLMAELEQIACVHLISRSVTPLLPELTGEFRRRKIYHWSIIDVQEWLMSLEIKEFYRQCFAEAAVDGFLLMALNDHDLNLFLSIDNKLTRKKIIQHVAGILDREQKKEENWLHRARAHRPNGKIVYIIYEPADMRLAQNLKADLKGHSMQVIHHNTTNLGHSKEEFLEINGTQIASASHVIIVLTEKATDSPFVFQEVLFSNWLGKRMIVNVFKNAWSKLRTSMKVVLGTCPAIDFENEMYCESLEVLKYHIQPARQVPPVVLEQKYVNKMMDGVKPFQLFSNQQTAGLSTRHVESGPRIFLSYQWDVQAKVLEIQQILSQTGYKCWSDSPMTSDLQVNTENSFVSSASSRSTQEPAHNHIYRTMKLCQVVLCCLTPKYLQSEMCIKALSMASALRKPVIPVVLKFVSTQSVHRTLGFYLQSYSCIDFSNEKLFKQNIPSLIQRIKRTI